MFRSCLALCLLAGGLLLPPAAARAQEGTIFAGGYFETLYAAIDLEYLKVDHSELRFHVIDRRLAALVIPDAQGDDPYILKCERRSTRLVRVPLSKMDVERLRDFAKDGLYQALQGVRSAPEDRKRVAELQRRIQELPAERRQSAQRFVGSRLADMDLPNDHALAACVTDYRKHIERRAIDTLKDPNKSKDLKEGVPQTFGTQTIDHSQLRNTKDIETWTINSKTYQRSWVEGALVIVQVSDKSPGKQLQVTPEIKKRMKPGQTGRTQVPPISHGKK